MAFSDYLCVYRQFFEEFAKSTELENHRPMRVNIYNLSIDELVGEVMQSCVNFLTERRCPNCLVVHITKIVVGELLSEAKKQPEEVNDPLKLNRKTFDKIREVCLRYTDNEKLSSLPGPVHETQFSTHATKHTRRRMEDRNICLPRFNTLHGIQSNSEAEYYGVFDGHAGVNAACYSVSHLHQFLAESQFYPDNPVEAFREAYEKTDSRLNLKNEESGTASLAILHQRNEKKLTVSWVGDSQALLVSEDSYVLLVDPHKPERPDERKRIEDLGGCILWSQDVCRVNGATAVSRALGDRKLKPFVCAEPEFRVVNLTGSEHFVVMGCDGLWDVVTPQQVLETVYFEVKQNEVNLYVGEGESEIWEVVTFKVKGYCSGELEGSMMNPIEI
ncbi:hypothetical protein RUM44_008408 [Polyplax serrata]|uniref:PPM-type phosphatase domain-containing protein n=1 Tax=Polyplax serrata TaxID=468196 RepID=A0ABR1BC63_POLSC